MNILNPIPITPMYKTKSPKPITTTTTPPPQSIHTEITTETIHLNQIFPIIKEYETMFEYKYIIHQFVHPLKKNIHSIQVKVNNMIPKIKLELCLYAGGCKLPDNVLIKPNRNYELLQFKYIPSQIINHQIQIVATVQNKKILQQDQEQTLPSLIPIEFSMDFNIQYSTFIDENISSVVIPHTDDIRNLTVKNGNAVIMKIHF